MHGYKTTSKIHLNFVANSFTEQYLYHAVVNHENDHSRTNGKCYNISGMDSKWINKVNALLKHLTFLAVTLIAWFQIQ